MSDGFEVFLVYHTRLSGLLCKETIEVIGTVSSISPGVPSPVTVTTVSMVI